MKYPLNRSWDGWGSCLHILFGKDVFQTCHSCDLWVQPSYAVDSLEEKSYGEGSPSGRSCPDLESLALFSFYMCPNAALLFFCLAQPSILVASQGGTLCYPSGGVSARPSCWLWQKFPSALLVSGVASCCRPVVATREPLQLAVPLGSMAAGCLEVLPTRRPGSLLGGLLTGRALVGSLCGLASKLLAWQSCHLCDSCKPVIFFAYGSPLWSFRAFT